MYGSRLRGRCAYFPPPIGGTAAQRRWNSSVFLFWRKRFRMRKMKAYGNDIPESYVKYRGFVGTWLQRVEGMRGSRRTRNGEVMVAIGRLRTKDRHPIWGSSGRALDNPYPQGSQHKLWIMSWQFGEEPGRNRGHVTDDS